MKFILSISSRVSRSRFMTHLGVIYGSRSSTGTFIIGEITRSPIITLDNATPDLLNSLVYHSSIYRYCFLIVIECVNLAWCLTFDIVLRISTRMSDRTFHISLSHAVGGLFLFLLIKSYMICVNIFHVLINAISVLNIMEREIQSFFFNIFWKGLHYSTGFK